MFHRLLVAFDGSSHAQRALGEAIDLARPAGAELAVLTVALEASDPVLATSRHQPRELTEQIKRSYQHIRCAIDAVPDDLPVTASSGADPRAQRSSKKPVPVITT
jgi:nucleotide-binding universal stress UspA family protein